MRKIESLFDLFQDLRDLADLEKEEHSHDLRGIPGIPGILIEIFGVVDAVVKRRIAVERKDKRNNGKNIADHVLLYVMLDDLAMILDDLPFIEVASIQIHEHVDDEHVRNQPEQIHRHDSRVAKVENRCDWQTEHAHENHEHIHEIPRELPSTRRRYHGNRFFEFLHPCFRVPSERPRLRRHPTLNAIRLLVSRTSCGLQRFQSIVRPNIPIVACELKGLPLFACGPAMNVRMTPKPSGIVRLQLRRHLRRPRFFS